MKDNGLPILKYQKGKSFKEWGIYHGEEHRDAIKELYEIRLELMLKRNPSLKNHLDPLAKQQFDITAGFAPGLAEEIAGIAKGSNLSLTDIVILNNYTDFRDIELPEEGCSTIQVQNKDSILCGQTWDMHSSAKNYLSLIEIPESENGPSSVILSLLGCTGLMGVNSHQCVVGVNNINTTNAKIGMIWPALVRQLLLQDSLSTMRDSLLSAPVTSGHNYLLSSLTGAEHWEITPTEQDLVYSHSENEESSSFHTNHCLGPNVKKQENKDFISATTHARHELLEKNLKDVHGFSDLKSLLQSHEGHPLSICSHYGQGAKDPSQTCGGGIADLTAKEYLFWRGCPKYDDTYKEIKYHLCQASGAFKRVDHE